MLKYIIAVLISIAGVLAWMLWGIGVPDIYSEELPKSSVLHAVGNLEKSIEEIEIAAFYFVPKNKKANQLENWNELLEKHLNKLVDFHSIQFRNRSSVVYKIYPKVVVGLEENIVYDTNNTQNGNPQALIHVAEELAVRVFRKDGDLFDAEFSEKRPNAYPVMAILYEGVGASGGIIHNSKLDTADEIAEELGLLESTIFVLDIDAVDGFFILNQTFLANDEDSVGTSLMAHEFYHTLGISDQYIAPKAVPTSQDIMGLGRLRPIEKTYLSRGALNEFGM